MYTRYSLAELTAHLVALLERRRAAFEVWSQQIEDALTREAVTALEEARTGFAELADDPAYWARTSRTLIEVAVPRYLKLAKRQHELERSAYGAWRNGDLISRMAYAGMGLIAGIIIIRTPIPDFLEPLPILMFLGGPLLPDVQAWWAKRRYTRQLATLVDDMGQEQRDAREYQSLGIAPVSSDTSGSEPPPQVEQDKTRSR